MTEEQKPPARRGRPPKNQAKDAKVNQPVQDQVATTDTVTSDVPDSLRLAEEKVQSVADNSVGALQDVLGKFGTFLDEHFPSERRTDEDNVTLAQRLLLRLSPYGYAARCPEEYCNKPKGHQPTDDHGWVNAEAPRRLF